ncbi:MAG: sialate O-acetylesterase [Opitutales bacterium]
MHKLRHLPVLGLLAVVFSPFASAQTEPEGNPAPSARPATTIFTQTPAPTKDNFRIYLLMGQSNMAGRGSIAGSQATNPRLLMLDPEGRWVLAKDPLHQQVGRIKPGVGPGLSFAREMLKADPKVTIGLVPCAVGGTPMQRWEKSKRGDLYKRAVERAQLAAQVGVISGVLWHQGESDTGKMGDAESYQARLSRMIKNLREDLGRPELPVVVGQLGEFLSVDEKHPGLEAVRAAIRKIPDVVPHNGYADSAGLKDKGDKLHFDADGANKLGVRYANAMQQLQKK